MAKQSIVPIKKNLKILIIRFSSIGDIVLTTPVIRCLKTQLDAEIHYLTKFSYADILAGNPYIDKLWFISSTINETIKILKLEKFDAIIDLHKNIRSGRIVMALPGRKITYHKTTLEKYLLLNLRVNKLPKVHVVDRYMKTAEKLGAKNDGKGLDFFINHSIELPSDLPEKYIVAVIGATHFTKRLPSDQWIRLINSMSETFVLLGGPSETEDSEIIVRATKENVINYVGKTDLQTSALILKIASLVITNDTGMLHIAAALQKEIISIWGGTLKEYGFWPYYPEGMALDHPVEIKDLKCRPCSKFGRQDCPKKHFNCMKAIDVAEIKNTALSILNQYVGEQHV